MKCSLCGSRVEDGVCTFCGMPAAEETFDKETVAKVIKDMAAAEHTEKVEIKPERLPAVYEEHYERRHIHSEQEGGFTITSLMVKAVLLIILSIIAYIVIISGPSEIPGMDAPEIRNEDTVLVWK